MSMVFSLVSHGQLHLIQSFLRDYRRLGLSRFPLVLTLNIHEDESVLRDFSDLPITLVRNAVPKGFGENHNAAFHTVESRFFIVVNPDIRLRELDQDTLLQPFQDESVAAVAPVVTDSAGHLQDSARRFPTLVRLMARALLGRRSPDYVWQDQAVEVEWVAGMFIVFRSDAFRRVNGFDTRFYMYMEDADICRRLRVVGGRTVLHPLVSVIHDAQRASRHDVRHLKWHLASACRFLFLPPR
jgi:N-acetylglucosaminyl-diphospho-decaprenol L-rhamnosyltransferase